MSKNKNLKFDLTSNSTNNPVDSKEIYAKALLQGGSMGTFTPIVDAKDIARIRKHNFGVVLQADSCDFTPSGAGELTEKKVEVCPVKINLKMCQLTLEGSYLANTMKAGSNHADFMPAEFSAYFTDQLAKEMSSEYEVLTWRGDTAGSPADICDGLITKFLADSDVIDVNGAVTNLTVIAELNKTYAAIPQEVLFDENLRLYVSSNVLASYRQAVSAASAEGYYDAKLADPTFLGIPMVLAQGLNPSDIVAMSTDNVFLITDLVSDFTDVNILPQYDIDGSNNIHVASRAKFAVDYVYGEEIVYHAA